MVKIISLALAATLYGYAGANQATCFADEWTSGSYNYGDFVRHNDVNYACVAINGCPSSQGSPGGNNSDYWTDLGACTVSFSLPK